MHSAIIHEIQSKVRHDMAQLQPHLQAWAREHLIMPHQFEAFCDIHCSESPEQFWLVTDHCGTHDSSYRVIYDEKIRDFGLCMTLQGGQEYCLGIYGGFAETIENM